VRAVRTVVNRILLALTGLVLLALGGPVLAVGLGAPAPSWWIHRGPHDVLLTGAERTRWREAGWWWPAVLTGLALLVLLALWWLLAVVRRRRLTEVLVDTGDGAGALLRGRALEDVLAEQAAGTYGVAHARARLTGRPTAPEARVRLRTRPQAEPGAALEDFTAGALEAARASAGLADLPAEVTLTEVRHRADRVG
jgi:hypothetical protein